MQNVCKASEVCGIVGLFEHGIDQVAIQVKKEDVIVPTFLLLCT